MRLFLFGIILFIAINISFAESIKVSDGLILHKLSENTYIHTQKNNNGLVYINNKEAVIVSTPASDLETQNLIDWVEKKSKIVAYIIDRWHPDAMEGLDIVHKNGIKSFAYEKTRQIAKKKNLPIPKIGFDPKKVIKVGDSKIVCHFLGKAHTSDGIVVWLPSEKILFGGNEIRNNNGWIGNVGDANIYSWSQTATNIKKEYGSAKIVIPGHGKYGGVELIDYTIDLYKFPKNNFIENNFKTSSTKDFKKLGDFYIKAGSISTENKKQILKNVFIMAQDSTKFIEIESSNVEYKPNKKIIDSKLGRLKIYDKKENERKLRLDVNYKRLIMYKVDDIVGFAVILKEITNDNH